MSFWQGFFEKAAKESEETNKKKNVGAPAAVGAAGIGTAAIGKKMQNTAKHNFERLYNARARIWDNFKPSTARHIKDLRRIYKVVENHDMSGIGLTAAGTLAALGGGGLAAYRAYKNRKTDKQGRK